MNQAKKLMAVVILLLMITLKISAQHVAGVVKDATTGEALVGAVVEVTGTDNKTVTDINGHFAFDGLTGKTCKLTVSYLGYLKKEIDGVQVTPSAQNDLEVRMKADEQQLHDVTVTAVVRRNTEAAAVQEMKSSSVIVSNVSAQEISKTQDSNAGEVIRRIPGVSLIDDKFVMVRGLSQRYNNVWINGGAVPSSEADSRAFSFDMIPSSQIDNLTIVKTPAAEYPADYSGGFIIINTKGIPQENTFSVQVGGNWNTSSSFASFTKTKGSSTDFLGFDGGLRSMHGGIEASLNPLGAYDGVSLTGNHFNNDWTTSTTHPFGDLKLGLSLTHHWQFGAGKLGMIAAANYTNEYRTYKDMKNNLFGVYDAVNDRDNYLRNSTDDQYNHNVRIGAMVNFTFLSKGGNNKYEFKNIFNQLGNNRYTWRDGVSAQANLERSAEYYYRSRTTYNGQVTGKHSLGNDEIEWSASYSYANRHIPDRRRYMIDDALESNVYQLSNGNDISREWTQLDEHIMSANVSDKHQFRFGNWTPSLRVGAYGEYRTRKYTTRNFIYSWNTTSNNLPSGFRKMDMTQLLSDESYFGEDGLYLIEQQQMRNNYRGHNTLGAGFLAATLPFGAWNIYAGLRYEYKDMELISNLRDTEKSESSRHYRHNDLFPSVNITYVIDKKNQLRLSYGKSVNHPEFREISSSVFYDFDLASSVQGNPELQSCYIHNVDIRYEWYPSRGEVISLAGFYKYFDNPIEWTYTVTGGTDLVYSYKNAKSANSFGLELDVKKDLSFIGLPNFSWSFNGALIHSRVKFDANDPQDSNRPMQGQSPYLINTGIFYKNPKWNLDVALLYNRIGKRLIGVGRSEGTTGDNENARVPDSYEMPRDVFDFSASKKFGTHFEVKLNVRDLLNEKVYYKQFADVTYSDGRTAEKEEITRSYRPGMNIGLSAIYKF
ncbi:MAG: TonB-dependent receptor domain-containing protein [Prevotella sp.]|jgi:hypothetical protein